MMPSIRVLLLLPCLAAFAPAFQPAGEFKPGKLPAAEVAALAPGLTLRFYARPGDAAALDARRIRVAALHVPKGADLTPFVPARPVHARITGYLKNPIKGDYTFRLTGTGAMTLRINDKEVKRDAEFELAKNYNRLEIVYSGPAQGDATVRLEWAGEKFGYEPVPPDMLVSRKDDADLVEKTALREGRELFASMHCVSCHTPKLAGGEFKMPELKNHAPALHTGGRFQQDWLVAWLLDPRALRPEATMPRVLIDADAEAKAADIAAWVLSGKGAGAEPANAEKPSTGEALFKKLGCVTCHRLNDPAEKDDLDRLSLHYVGVKFAKGALARFLKAPHEHYPWTRMPDFRLSVKEAQQLEAYLLDGARGKVAARPKGDVKRGEKLYVEVGCVRCHDTIDRSKPPSFAAIDFKAFERGCLADKERGKAPHFHLSPTQRTSLAAFLRTDMASLLHETPAEFSLRQVKTLRCDSCHRRDGEVTRWHAVLEDEGKLPENLPSLTWVGEKLKPAWTRKLLAGETDHSARPWIKGRMPAFPARADLLAVGLSHEHGFGVDEDDRPKPDANLAAVGEKLIPQQGGFNCNNCHGIGKTPAIQPFEAPGINLLDAAVRLRYGYYQRWMLAPDRVDVTMRMPVFAADGKSTQIRDVLDGDARRQFDALWHFIQTLPGKAK